MSSNSDIIEAFITDTHGDQNNRDLILQIFSQFFSRCKELGLTRAFHLGDFLIDRTGQGLVTLYLLIDVARIAKKYGITMYIIPGNHDKTNQSSHRSYLGIYNHPNVIVMDCKNPSVSFIADEDNGIRWHFLPYFKDEIYSEKLTQLRLHPEHQNILLTHVGIEGVLNNHGEQEDRVPRVGRFSQFDLVLTGHYHNRQKVTKKIHYIGSSHQANYGEDERKGWAFLTSSGKLLYERSESPIWRKVTLDTSVLAIINAAVEKHLPDVDKLRFEFRLEPEDWARVDADALRNKGIDVTWVDIKSGTVNDDEVESSLSTTAFTPKDVRRNFIRYCVEQKISSAQRKYGQQLLENSIR